MLADDYSPSDDRRRVVGAGIRHGRDGLFANLRTSADLGLTNATATVIATRGSGSPLPLHYVRADTDEQSEVSFAEIDPDERIGTRCVRPGRRDAAFAELDARTSPASCRPRPDMVCHRAGASLVNRRELPRRHRMGEHRPSTARNVRGGRSDRIPPCHVGPHTGLQHATSRLCIG